jgi:hypothetical protein
MSPILNSGGILLLIFAGITACKKTSDDKVRNLDKLRISRITQTTVSQPNIASVTDFVYDDQQRVDKIVFSDGKWVNGDFTTKPTNSAMYYYNGTDKNPYKASGAISTASRTADIYYTYNTAGVLIRDSAKSTSTSQVITHDYTYSFDRLLVIKGYYYIQPNGMIAGNTHIDTFSIKNNNIAEVVYGTASIGQPAYYYQLSYDDKINPMSKLNIAAVNIIEGLKGFPDNAGPGFCKNNITAYISGSIAYGGKRTEHVTQPYIFSYTKEGLPETCTITTQSDTYKFKYTYEEF